MSVLDDIHNFLSVIHVYEPAWTLKCWFFYLFTLANRQITMKVWCGGKR